jgi:hypothetical protein
MADLVRLDRTDVSNSSHDIIPQVFRGARLFNGPDGLLYRWRQREGSPEVQVGFRRHQSRVIAHWSAHISYSTAMRMS